ncbi:hypothetical protein EIP91_005786 [Steccherinum ochraceum]|uniref:Uncharacterized protein n=1 Tax=Steccherinum ochraceum TaxID=92696 RepID=A0A4R0RCS3_9APHY|nr:hypothetical protein EIP91_005786 [Steccherinum ochraceum]
MQHTTTPTPHSASIVVPIPRYPPRLAPLESVVQKWKAPKLPPLDFELFSPLPPAHHQVLDAQGDIVLMTPSQSGIRVSTEFLARKAEYLWSSLELMPSATATTYLWEIDYASGLLFMAALYEREPLKRWYRDNTDPRRAEGIMALCRILQLSTYYGSAALRRSTLKALREVFPTNLQKFENMIFKYKGSGPSLEPKVIVGVLNSAKASGAPALRCSARYCALHVGLSVVINNTMGFTGLRAAQLNDEDKVMMKQVLKDQHLAEQGRTSMLYVLDHCIRGCEESQSKCWKTDIQRRKYQHLKGQLDTLDSEDFLSPFSWWNHVKDFRPTMCGRCLGSLERNMRIAIENAWERTDNSFEPSSHTGVGSSLRLGWQYLETMEQSYVHTVPVAPEA